MLLLFFPIYRETHAAKYTRRPGVLEHVADKLTQRFALGREFVGLIRSRSIGLMSAGLNWQAEVSRNRHSAASILYRTP